MTRPLLRAVVVGAALLGAAPAFADLVLPKQAPAPAEPTSKPTAEPTSKPTSEAAVVEPTVVEPDALDEPIDVDAKVETPPVPMPPPVDEELMKELPPPAIGLGDIIGPLAKTMVMLCVVLLIVYLTLHKGLGKLVERQNSGKRVKVVERVVLDQKRSLFLVEIDGKQMLLAAGDGIVHIKDVASVDVPDSRANGGGLGARFADALKRKVPGQPPVTTGLSRSPDQRDDATFTAEASAAQRKAT